MPFVSIRLVKEVIADDPGGKKAAMATKIVAAIAETIGLTQDTGLTKDDVWVAFEEVAARDWFVCDTRVQERRQKT
ncbi:MAG: tautomerase family protein [Undibacterium sp.]|nr:tautomerase family protein [Opitutaceae bacterium]